jgi:hypothetical protein
VRSIQLLVPLPHSHIDPNWLSTGERESRNQPENQERPANHILIATGSLPISRLLFTHSLAITALITRKTCTPRREFATAVMAVITVGHSRHSARWLGNTVSGVFTSVLAKHSKNFHRICDRASYHRRSMSFRICRREPQCHGGTILSTVVSSKF